MACGSDREPGLLLLPLAANLCRCAMASSICAPLRPSYCLDTFMCHTHALTLQANTKPYTIHRSQHPRSTNRSTFLLALSSMRLRWSNTLGVLQVDLRADCYTQELYEKWQSSDSTNDQQDVGKRPFRHANLCPTHPPASVPLVVAGRPAAKGAACVQSGIASSSRENASGLMWACIPSPGAGLFW